MNGHPLDHAGPHGFSENLVRWRGACTEKHFLLQVCRQHLQQFISQSSIRGELASGLLHLSEDRVPVLKAREDCLDTLKVRRPIDLPLQLTDSGVSPEIDAEA